MSCMIHVCMYVLVRVLHEDMTYPYPICQIDTTVHVCTIDEYMYCMINRMCMCTCGTCVRVVMKIIEDNLFFIRS